MQLGTETGSLVNHIYSRMKSIVPEIGMGATVLLWSDRQAHSITRVSASGKTFWMTRDIATRIDKNGRSESQEYTFEIDKDAVEDKVTLRKDGTWKIEKINDTVIIGKREEYRDFSF